MSSAALGRLTFVTPQAANEMVTTLERKGFLERFVDEDNRRRLEVDLTRAGKTALAKCDKRVDQLEAEVFHDVVRSGRERFRRTLETCLAATTRVGTRSR
jgi:DNA-binding MarR family transcriptional regulator